MSDIKFEELRRFYPNAQKVQEGQRLLALLPNLMVSTSSGTRKVNALLYPHEHNGYLSRLFFSESLPSDANFSAVTVCGATWYACSWQGVSASLPWAEIVANHLRAIK